MSNVIPLRPEPTSPAEPEPLWRAVLGEQLRNERLDRDERIVDVAARAGVAPQYLSELERGRKDPSSEVLAAVSCARTVGLRADPASRDPVGAGASFRQLGPGLPGRLRPISPAARAAPGW